MNAPPSAADGGASAFPAPRRPIPGAGALELSELWPARWPDVRPIGHRLRGGDQWVRFHSLPESKRYADNDDEYAELLRRHRAVLGDLAALGAGPSGLWVITCTWSAGPDPLPRPAPLAAATPDSAYWQSLPPDDYSEAWTHLFAGRVGLDDQGLDTLLCLVADGVTSDVILADADLRWLYHPYDGGADVIAPTSADRDVLQDRYAAWLPDNPSGL